MKYEIHTHFKFVIIVFIAGLLSLSMVGRILAIAATRVSVSSSTLVDGERILLGEIAKIEGDDPILIKRLNRVDIGQAPLPGKKREIQASAFNRCLKQDRIDPSHLVMHLPAKVIVERSLVEISAAKIKALVSDYISKNLLRNLNDAGIKDIRVTESLRLPGGRITYTVKPSRNNDIMGKIPFTVNFEVNGKFYKRIWAMATVEVFSNVVMTKKPLGRHKPITEDDIELQKLDLAKLPSDVITDPEVVLGQRTRRAIGSQTVLRSNLVEFPPLVKRGDVVVIIVESAGFKITALGQVKKKGRLGDRIPVINFDSKKILYARVVDSNTVKVDFK
ncbi:MAG: flagellar basal body P-ring formation protein FlgA [Deltaproteobacteria bacterium]|nr:flagellar basal body P-ring formation protein FlgA [Deltaproteobacteria bacterium]